MLSEAQTLTQIMNNIKILPPQSRLRLVQLTLDTLIEPTASSLSKLTANLDGTQNQFHRLQGIATVKMSTESKQRFLKGNSDKEWLKSVKPVNVGFPLTEEWLFEAKCEGRE